ncbi:MAG: sulfite exporter TauE/SafE family protein [Anaerolineae bacterium]
MIEPIYIILAIFLGTFTATTLGFGKGLIVMPILTILLGLDTAAPLTAMAMLTSQILVILWFRSSFSLKDVMPLILPATIGIPTGLYIITVIDELILRPILGALIILYMLYRIFQPELTPMDPAPKPLTWAAGFFAGLLTGAYNTPGPPVVIYGDVCCWEKDRFRVNLQSFFIFCSSVTLFGHLLQGRLTASVMMSYGWVLVGIFGGMSAGIMLDKYIPANVFRWLVQILLLVIGATMIWSIF